MSGAKILNPDKDLEKPLTKDKVCKVGSFVGNMKNEKDENYIRTYHGDILSHAGLIPGKESPVRDQVVRKGSRKTNGLNGCVQCHQTRTEFCDKCHKFIGVHSVNEHTGCFACHFYPKDKTEWSKWNKSMEAMKK